MSETHLYRLWHGNNNNRSEIARLRAKDFDDVVKYVKKEFLKPGAEITDTFGDEISLYLNLDVCKRCDAKTEPDFTEDDCEGCETSEYLQIELNDEIEPEYNTIFGTNEFYDLLRPELLIKATPWSPELKKAWETDPVHGPAALIAKTIEDNPELIKGIDPELLKRGRAVLKGDTKK